MVTVAEKIASITIEETRDGIRVTNRYVILDAVDYDDAIAALQASPLAPLALAVNGTTVTRLVTRVNETERVGDFEGEAEWGKSEAEGKKPPPQPQGTDKASVTIGPRGDNIKQAINQQVFAAPGQPGNVVNHGLMVGWNEGGGWQGAPDKPRGIRLSVTRARPANQITAAYIKRLAELQGTRNLLPFKGYDVGLLFFEQVSIQERNNEEQDFELTFDFVVGKPLVNENVAGVPGVNADAHDVIEVRWRQEAQPAFLNIKPEWKVIAVIVSTIFDTEVWTDLGIGV